MIEQIQFTNFMALKEVSLPLGRLTVLVGPNASGKTSILRGILYLSELTKKTPLQLFETDGKPPLWDLCHFGANKVSLSFSGSLSGGRWIVSNQSIRGSRGVETLATLNKTAVGVDELRAPQPIHPLRQQFSKVVSLQLDRLYLELPSSPSSDAVIEEDGFGLASALEELKVSHDERFASLINALRAVVPHFERIHLPKEQITKKEIETLNVNGTPVPRQVEKKYWGRKVVFDFKGASGVPAELVSEGTLLTLGLLTVLYQPTPPNLLLLDDIDRGLHPKAQGELIAQLRKLLEMHPDLQIVATSHSPYLLDHLQFEEIRIGTIDDDGSALWASMKDHPRFEEWKTLMSPGELWSHAGEAWIKDLPKRDAAQ